MTGKRDDGGAAFPVPQSDWAYDRWGPIEGMSMRDWFAGKVLQGLAANPNIVKTISGRIGGGGPVGVIVSDGDLVHFALEQADLLLEARKK